MKTHKSFVLLHNDTDHVFFNHSDDDEQVQTNDRQTDSTNMAKKTRVHVYPYYPPLYITYIGKNPLNRRP